MIRLATILLPISLLISSFSLWAQSSEILSIKEKLKHVSSIEERYNLMDTLYSKFEKISQDSCLRWAKQKYNVAKDINDVQLIKESLLDLATSQSNVGQHDEAIKNIEQALELVNRSPIGKFGYWNCYNILASIYSDMGNYEKSLKCNLDAMKYAQENDDKFSLGSSHNNIGNVYRVMGNYDRSLESYKQAVKCFSEIKNLDMLAASLNNIGVVYAARKNRDSALIYYNSSLKNYELCKDLYGMATALNNIGGIYYDKGEIKKVIECDTRALDLYERIGSRTGVVVTLNNMAGDYREIKDYDRAVELSTKSLAMARKYTMKEDIQLAYTSLSEIYSAKKDFEKAFLYSEMVRGIRDTIYSEQNRSKIIEMQEKYETDKKQKEIEVLNATGSKNRIIIYAASGGFVLIFILAILLYNRNRVKQRANKLLELQNTEIQAQKHTIEEKNKDITDSIRYAQRIQNAILPSEQMIKALFPGSFVLFKPKDIVSGDFYWFEKWGNEILFAAVDCTGHGVPGALMSVVGYNLLNQAVNEHGLTKPNLILNELNKGISKMMRQHVEERMQDGMLTGTSVQDGMDIALCSYRPDKMVLQYAGAFNALYHIRKKELMEIKADKIAIGSYRKDELKSYSNQELQLQRGDTVYVFTDGFADQFGGPKGKKFKYKALQDLLIKIQDHDMVEQKKILSRELETWKGNLDQVDDILVIGISV